MEGSHCLRRKKVQRMWSNLYGAAESSSAKETNGIMFLLPNRGVIQAPREPRQIVFESLQES